MKKLLFENTVCGRCGGSGQYFYTSIHGKGCFKCNGQGAVLTKRGAAAQKFLTELRSRKVQDIKVGDVIREMNITMGGQPFDGWYTVTDITADIQKGSSLKDGVMVPYELPVVVLALDGKYGKMNSHKFLDTIVRVFGTAEERAATAAQALEYQATLTKSGTPMKRPAKGAEVTIRCNG